MLMVATAPHRKLCRNIWAVRKIRCRPLGGQVFAVALNLLPPTRRARRLSAGATGMPSVESSLSCCSACPQYQHEDTPPQ